METHTVVITLKTGEIVKEAFTSRWSLSIAENAGKEALRNGAAETYRVIAVTRGSYLPGVGMYEVDWVMAGSPKVAA